MSGFYVLKHTNIFTAITKLTDIILASLLVNIGPLLQPLGLQSKLNTYCATTTNQITHFTL